MFHFSESLEWIVHLNGSASQESVFSLAQCPEARKSLSLCLLYFQEDLGNAAKDYVLAQHSYYSAVVSVYDEQNGHCTAGRQFVMKNPNHKDITENLFKKKNEFENLIIAHSSKYTLA